MGWTSSPLCTRTTSDAWNPSPAFPSILPAPHMPCTNGTKASVPTTSSIPYGWVHPWGTAGSTLMKLSQRKNSTNNNATWMQSPLLGEPHLWKCFFMSLKKAGAGITCVTLGMARIFTSVYDFHSLSASWDFTDAWGAERDALLDVCYIYEPGGPNCPNYTRCLAFTMLP